MKLFATLTEVINIPPKQTQADLVLAVLKYRGATTTDIFEELGIKSPSSVIHRLRKSGYQIKTKRIWKKTKRYSWIMLQAEYTLDSNYEMTFELPICVDFRKEGIK